MKMRGNRKSSPHWPSQGGTRACKCEDCKDIITVDRAQEKREARREVEEQTLGKGCLVYASDQGGAGIEYDELVEASRHLVEGPAYEKLMKLTKEKTND